eukprot:CAMPEP_0197833210 /NCGR_PEP_ID=MMETSP1437-20131217/18199_1 /TAXON_ID=49252 ORGANISM="Eucampia antarctica, Strain CCMP1452" /NCGR_SAMPLE_ID=MMETSP1437 /ASSEMBLY_ACC=CAM_ASM_001096 /LENGTH=215 /DNA_ID=CAMNT_0043437127 /DNA_START=61 /DNA_END=708 /DNA_ORIENTATION=+
MASKAASFIMFHQLLILLSLSCSEVIAWQQSANSRKCHHEKACVRSKNILPTSPRRQFFFEIARTASIAAVTTAILPNKAFVASAAAPTAESARTQWKYALATLDELGKDWSTVATGGDAIRIKLGTQGTSSPLFQIDKAFKVLRDSDYVEDFIEFQETAEEFGLALARADSMAYSANFAGGSGKPTPPAFYIEKSKIEVDEMQRLAKKLDGMVK